MVVFCINLHSLTSQAHRYLREEVKTFQGKPIMVSVRLTNRHVSCNLSTLYVNVPGLHLTCYQSHLELLTTQSVTCSLIRLMIYKSWKALFFLLNFILCLMSYLIW